MRENEDKVIEELLDEWQNNNVSFKELLFKLLIEVSKEEKEKDLNKPYIISYKNIVDKTASFLNSELLVEDPITASIIFEYLLWNGYFSNEHFYQFRMDERINNFSSFGADIMRGQGVCLNNATMLTDVLKQMDYNVCSSICYVHKNGEIPKERNNMPPIERNIYSGTTLLEKIKNKKNILVYQLLKPIALKFGNHAIVLNEYDGNVFAIDPTNLCFMTYKEDNVLTSLNGVVDFDLKKTFTSILNSDSVDKVNDMYNKINNTNNSSIDFLNNDFISNYYLEQINYCESKKDLLEDFHQECKSDIKTIYKTLTKHK